MVEQKVKTEATIKSEYKNSKHGYRTAIKSSKKILKEDFKKNQKYLKEKYKANMKSLTSDNKTVKEGYKTAYKRNKLELKNEYKLTKHQYIHSYKEHKKTITEKFVKELDYYFKHECEKPIVNPPYRKTLEEIGNAVTHGVGSIFAIFAFVLMIMKAKTTVQIVSTFIYGLGMFFMFTMSCLYHSFAYGTKVKRLFRRFDYSSIYLLIGATYTPIVLCYLGGTFGLVFCLVQWAIIITGITLIAVYGPARLRKVHLPLYVILGWSALLFLPQMIMHDLNFFWWILAGGLCYTLGIIPFALNKGPAHFIWHFFVLAGAITQWVGIYLYLF